MNPAPGVCMISIIIRGFTKLYNVFRESQIDATQLFLLIFMFQIMRYVDVVDHWNGSK